LKVTRNVSRISLTPLLAHSIHPKVRKDLEKMQVICTVQHEFESAACCNRIRKGISRWRKPDKNNLCSVGFWSVFIFFPIPRYDFLTWVARREEEELKLVSLFEASHRPQAGTAHECFFGIIHPNLSFVFDEPHRGPQGNHLLQTAVRHF
jgi:hypothetical protein